MKRVHLLCRRIAMVTSSLVLLTILLWSSAAAGSAARPAAGRPPAAVHAVAASPAAPPAIAAPFGAGMRVAIDPQTGRIVPPTVEQMLRLNALTRTGLMRTTRGLTAVRLADGTMMLDLQGRYREFATARIDSRGVAQFRCVHGERALRTALDPCTPPPPPRYEER